MTQPSHTPCAIRPRPTSSPSRTTVKDSPRPMRRAARDDAARDSADGDAARRGVAADGDPVDGAAVGEPGAAAEPGAVVPRAAECVSRSAEPCVFPGPCASPGPVVRMP